MPEGDNSIVIFGGANKTIDATDINQVFDVLEADDVLLLQNEISCMPEILARAAAESVKVVFNTAPVSSELVGYPLDAVTVLILNEVEGEALAHVADPDLILQELSIRYPDTAIVLTLGEQGAWYRLGDHVHKQTAYDVTAVDATGAGDTFTGYFLAAWCMGKSIEECLKAACMAGALCCLQAGAATSIPRAVRPDSGIRSQVGMSVNNNPPAKP